jgi:hypothetical protein
MPEILLDIKVTTQGSSLKRGGKRHRDRDMRNRERMRTPALLKIVV